MAQCLSEVVTNSESNTVFDASDVHPHRPMHSPIQKNEPELDKADRNNKLHTIRTDTRSAQPEQLAPDLNRKHLLVRQNMRDIRASQRRWISHDTRGRVSVSH